MTRKVFASNRFSEKGNKLYISKILNIFCRPEFQESPNSATKTIQKPRSFDTKIKRRRISKCSKGYSSIARHRAMLWKGLTKLFKMSANIPKTNNLLVTSLNFQECNFAFEILACLIELDPKILSVWNLYDDWNEVKIKVIFINIIIYLRILSGSTSNF